MADAPLAPQVTAEFDPNATAAPDPNPATLTLPGAAGGLSGTLPSVPGYELLRELGRGGMGAVYLARQQSLNREVALKVVLAGEHASANERIRFLAEAEAAAAVVHPNVAQVFEFGEHDGRPYLALEFCAGGSLSDTLKSGALSARAAAELVERIARGVQAAHALGIIHRDLKPGNVLLDAHGAPKVADFGLAKRGSNDLTRTGAVLGTPAYMAPEQAGGQAKFVGPTADVYALGVILFECLTGRVPFRSDSTLQLLIQVANEPPPAPRTLNPNVPTDLEIVCLKCLEKDPTRRYATAGDLADELARHLAGEPVQARALGNTEKLLRWAKRHPTTVVGGLAACVMIVSLLVFLSVNAQRAEQHSRDLRELVEQVQAKADESEQERRLAETARDRAASAEQAAQQQKADAQGQLYAASIDLAHREWERGNLTRAEQLLQELPRAQRGWEWRYLAALHRLERRTLVGHQRAITNLVAFDETLLSKDAQMIRIWHMPTGQEVMAQHYPSSPTVRSPDGTLMATPAGTEVALVRAADGGGRPRPQVPNGHILAVHFTADSQGIVGVTYDGRILQWSLTELTKPTTAPQRIPVDPRIPPVVAVGGKWVAAGNDAGSVTVWDATTGQRRHQFVGAFAHVSAGPAFSDDGKLLAAGYGEGSVHVWDLATGQERWRGRPHDAPVGAVVFAPDSRRLATGGDDGLVRLCSATGGVEQALLRGHTAGVRALAFTTNGDRLFSGSADGAIKEWSVEDGRVYGALARMQLVGRMMQGIEHAALLPPATQSCRTFFGQSGPVRHVSLTPNAHTAVAVGNNNNMLVAWDVPGNRQKWSDQATNGVWQRSVGSPDSQQIAAALTDNKSLQVTVWLLDAATGRRRRELKGGSGTAHLSYAPDGTRLAGLFAGTTDADVIVWDVRTGAEVARQHFAGLPVRMLAYVPDGRLLIGRARSVGLHDPTTLAVQHTFAIPDAQTVVVGPHGLLAFGCSEPFVRLFDLTGRELRVLEGHTGGSIQALAFNADGSRLASAGSDQTVIVWNTTDGRALLTLRESRRQVESVAWAGDVLAVASWDHALRLYTAPPDVADPAADWPLVFRDDFDRAEVGPRWQAPGWQIVDGRFRGELRDHGHYTSADAVPVGVRIPETAEVTFRVRTSHPMLVQTILRSATGEMSMQAMLSASPFQPAGASILLRRDQGDGQVLGVPRRKFVLEPQRTYRVRVRRAPTGLTLSVDDEIVCREPVPVGPAPVLQLEGSWGSVGQWVEFDDVEVRAPATAIRHQVLVDRFQVWAQRYLVEPAIVAAITADADLSADERTLLGVWAKGFFPAPNQLRDKATDTLLQPHASPADYALALTQIERAIALGPHVDHDALLALAWLRVGRAAEAVAKLDECVQREQTKAGYVRPGVWSILALARHATGAASAALALRNARDLLYLPGFADLKLSQTLNAEVEGKLHDRESADVRAIKTLVLGRYEAAYETRNVADHLATLAPGAQVRVGRGPEPDQYDVTHDYTAVVARRRLMLAASTVTTVACTDVQTDVRGDQGEVRYRMVLEAPGGWIVYHRQAQVRRHGVGWLVERTLEWNAATHIGTPVVLDAAHYARCDAAVSAAKGQPRRHAAALETARRYAEALAVLAPVLAQPDATAADWLRQGRLLFELGRVPEALAAFSRVAELAQQPPPKPVNEPLPLPWYVQRQRQVLYHSHVPLGLVWSPDSQTLAVTAADKLILYDAAGKLLLQTPAHEPLASDVAWSADGRWLVTGGGDALVKLWSVAERRVAQVFAGHSGLVVRVAFSADGTRIASGSTDGTARVWDIATGQELRRLPDLSGGAVYGLAWAPQGRMLATAGQDGVLRLWSDAAEPIQTIRDHRTWIMRLAFSADGTQIVSVNKAGGILCHEVATGKLVQSLRQPTHADGVALAPTGTRLATCGIDSQIRVWDRATGRLVDVLSGHTNGVFPLAWSPDGRRLASSGGDGTVRLWDMAAW